MELKKRHTQMIKILKIMEFANIKPDKYTEMAKLN